MTFILWFFFRLTTAYVYIKTETFSETQESWIQYHVCISHSGRTVEKMSMYFLSFRKDTAQLFPEYNWITDVEMCVNATPKCSSIKYKFA